MLHNAIRSKRWLRFRIDISISISFPLCCSLGIWRSSSDAWVSLIFLFVCCSFTIRLVKLWRFRTPCSFCTQREARRERTITAKEEVPSLCRFVSEQYNYWIGIREWKYTNKTTSLRSISVHYINVFRWLNFYARYSCSKSNSLCSNMPELPGY